MTDEDKYVILCVDDEENILKALERSLSIEGYIVLTALNGMEALEILENENVDLTISDQRMPEMMGSEFLRIVKEKYPHIIRIMLSGYSDFNYLVSAINEGEIFRLIPKPCDNEEVSKVIRLALEQNRVVKRFESVMKGICSMMGNFEDISMDTSEGQISVYIGKKGDKISSDVILNFTEKVLNSVRVKDGNFKITSGNIAKKEGKVMLNFNVGDRLTLKIEAPCPES